MIICHLKTIFDQLDITSLNLAADLDISRNTITSWTKNRTTPSIEVGYAVLHYLNQVAEARGLPVRWERIENIWEYSQ